MGTMPKITKKLSIKFEKIVKPKVVKTITKARLSSVLKESIVSPAKKHPTRVLLDVKNPMYYRLEAIRLIKEAEYCIKTEKYQELLKKAILCLALARHYDKENNA